MTREAEWETDAKKEDESSKTCRPFTNANFFYLISTSVVLFVDCIRVALHNLQFKSNGSFEPLAI